jgi:hypothetical protein
VSNGNGTASGRLGLQFELDSELYKIYTNLV